ncbi:hypothetical protein [Defluviimonas salinarum]|uniref:Uncharacterized protein n=1 Tax=Defluviimonas salinarum TaxID=2992147 RepID=A0ABT3J4K7_9RHOB|nr:hypothetical protein [Defluviimonas salinarum]MCW3782591.1 hypothetical protein [Defluviimonas salinarum]
MYGFYDPASLSIGDTIAVIDFISAHNASDVTKVEIRTAEEAREVSAALEAQKTFGITTRKGDMREIRGSVAFLSQGSDEALLSPESDTKKTIPLKMGFAVSKNLLPMAGFVIAQAAEQDGALIVHKMAMKSYLPMPESRPSIFDNRSNLN